MPMIKWICVLFFVAALSARATTRYVSPTGTGQYSTITAAINASANGDTILVGPGTYNEGIGTFSGRRTIIGAGWDQATVTGQVYLTSAVGAGTVIEGFRIAPINPCLNLPSCDSVTVRRCLLETAYNVVWVNGGNRITIEDCILIENGTNHMAVVSPTRVVFRNCLFVHTNGNSGTTYAISGNNGNLEVYNCVFLGLRRLLNCTGAQPITFINNVVYDWVGVSQTYGNYLAGSAFDYNASSVITPPGTNAILLTDDPFVSYNDTINYDEATSDLHPAPGSPIIDAGHPGIVDLDSSASDLGIYGGPRPLIANGVPSYPFVLSMTLTPVLIGVGDTVEVNSSARVGPRY